jgi:pyruvate kinase
MTKTKIIATVGPSSSTPGVIRRMMLAGLDVVRLNFSHGTPEERVGRIRIVRALNERYGRHLRILGDLEGPRIRIGALKDHQPLELKKGGIFWLSQKEAVGSAGIAPFDYKGSLRAIKKGQPIYIDDGNIFLKTLAVSGKTIKAEIVIGGLLKEHKGINMPGAVFSFERLTQKDKGDIDFAARAKMDYIAQSFVRSAQDVRAVKKRIRGLWPACLVVAKIESREGINNIDAIINESDGIMVARGDMGVCVPIYEVPMIQKQIIRKCNLKKKFVITATQMLEHMVDNRIPTRAEVTDVANAVLDGTDFAMLSAETASGRYPVEAVDMMNKIIKFTEQSRRTLS